MIRLKRKASEVAAMQWTGEGRNTTDLLAWCRGALIFALDDDGQTIIGRLATPSGITQLNQGDWVLCRTEGDYYPVKQAQLEELYETVGEPLPDITADLMRAQL